MVQITYISPDELYSAVTAMPGVSVLQAALDHGFPDVSAALGGRGACTNCHVHIRADRFDWLDPPSTLEAALLDFVSPHDSC